MIAKIIKRNGEEVNFEPQKIYNVISMSFTKNGIENKELVDKIYNEVMTDLTTSEKEIITVENVQNKVQSAFMRNGYFSIATRFIETRFEHKANRDIKNGIFDNVSKICKITDRENANVGNGPSSKMLQIAETTLGEYGKNYLLDKASKDALNQNKIYPHDHSWAALGTSTCTFIPLRKFLDNGFNTGHGFIRRPKRIRTAAQLSCIALQSNQNDQHR